MPRHAIDLISHTHHEYQFQPNPWLSSMSAQVQGAFRCDEDGDEGARTRATALFHCVIPNDAWIVICDSTLFKPIDACGRSDQGYMHSHYDQYGPNVVFTVTDVVKKKSGTIYHLGTFEPNHKPFLVGQSVLQQIDPELRLLESRIHVCGHLLGLVIKRLLNEGILKGLKEQRGVWAASYLCVDFDGKLETCGRKAKLAITQELNSMIKKDIRLEICSWKQDEAEKEGVKVDPNREMGPDDFIRAIKIPGEGWYMCPGTIVAKTGTIGLAAVTRIQTRNDGTEITRFIYGIQREAP